jgi:pyruvate formate lyase activating enzyme
VGNRENTYCSKCHELLIERYGYLIVSYHVSAHGTCPACGASVPGKWDAKFGGQRTSRPFVPMSAVR